MVVEDAASRVLGEEGMEEGVGRGRGGTHGNSLYYLCNFSVTLKTAPK